jgi:uncharacterized glyoxalase superfamily protein PhnB
MAKATSAVPAGFHTLIPQLSVDNAAEAIEWYRRAFGAEERNRGLGPDGKIMHAEVTIGDSRFFVNDVMPGQKGPKALGGSPASFWLYVNDADATYNRAIEAGATVQVPLDNQFWGDRGGAVADPAGYTWWIASRVEDLTHDEIMVRAAEFFRQMAQA